MKESIRHLSISDLDFEYKLWKNTLNYFLDDHQVYLGRIEELIHQNSFEEDMDELYELQFGFQETQQRIQWLLKQIKIREEEMALQARDYPISEQHRHYREHEAIREHVQNVVISENILKGRFADFLP